MRSSAKVMAPGIQSAIGDSLGVRVVGSLALVTNHFEVSHSNVASFGGLLLLVLLSFAFFLLDRFWPERSCDRHLMTEMLRELHSLAAETIGFPVLSSDGILTSLITLLQAACDAGFTASHFFLRRRARRDIHAKCEHEQQQCGQPNQFLHVQPPEDELGANLGFFCSSRRRTQN